MAEQNNEHDRPTFVPNKPQSTHNQTQEFLSNERTQQPTNTTPSKIDKEIPLLSDLNISVVPLNISSANECNANVSVADTISIGSDTSAQFDSLQFISDTDTTLDYGKSINNFKKKKKTKECLTIS